MKYTDSHIESKLAYLDKAIEIYGATVSNFDSEKDHVAGIISVAKQIEAYVYSDFKQETKPQLLTEAQQRQAFLDSLPKTSCGRGRDDCDGSEGTCSCQ